ncbi:MULTISPECIES: hypothetical protein [unclassified Modestobacter]|uniref:hypothetical protein n=1 Tax=unclassified Modestobacter TaxID=2643866 RepID=UPI0022A9F8DB|nr:MULTISPECIES: hypothetical protein [unclassified Modestobacter]MCZ2814325.1 hypothetical protein [Modestobacter sp. VKM Ac-2979]MCZ2843983.1 hypothetical protein [Modestobacter sp. VKM Ac-2980]MCZ2850661.1 hypothetical protein [Modestobacter sp. VKM Ac-2978]
MADPTGGERSAGWARSAYAWLLVRPVSRGFWAAALVFLVLVTVSNAVDGDWLSVALGSLLAAVVGLRLWDLRGASGDLPASGQDRTASR